jgi:hypothetical protein
MTDMTPEKPFILKKFKEDEFAPDSSLICKKFFSSF